MVHLTGEATFSLIPPRGFLRTVIPSPNLSSRAKSRDEPKGRRNPSSGPKVHRLLSTLLIVNAQGDYRTTSVIPAKAGIQTWFFVPGEPLIVTFNFYSRHGEDALESPSSAFNIFDPDQLKPEKRQRLGATTAAKSLTWSENRICRFGQPRSHKGDFLACDRLEALPADGSHLELQFVDTRKRSQITSKPTNLSRDRSGMVTHHKESSLRCRLLSRLQYNLAGRNKTRAQKVCQFAPYFDFP